MFLSAIFGAIDEAPYQKIGEYLDDGSFSLTTGRKTVDANGQTLRYGPVVNFMKTTTPAVVTIEFIDPKPQSQLKPHCWATVHNIEFEVGGDTYATGDLEGFVQRKKLVWQ